MKFRIKKIGVCYFPQYKLWGVFWVYFRNYHDNRLFDFMNGKVVRYSLKEAEMYIKLLKLE